MLVLHLAAVVPLEENASPPLVQHREDDDRHSVDQDINDRHDAERPAHRDEVVEGVSPREVVLPRQVEGFAADIEETQQGEDEAADVLRAVHDPVR